MAMSLLAAALVLLAAGQNRRGVIRGIVRGPDGAPLPGARVVADTAPGETVRRPRVSVDTAEDGTYALHPRPGTFEVRVELDGVRSGRIVWRGKDEEGVRDGMPLATFLDRLRELRD